MPGAYPADVSEFDTSLGIRLDYEACMAYLFFPPLGAIFLLIMERNSDYVRSVRSIPSAYPSHEVTAFDTLLTCSSLAGSMLGNLPWCSLRSWLST